MPNSSIDDFSNVLQAELDAEQRRAIGEVQEVEADANRNGVFQGSRRMLHTAHRLGDSVVRFRKVILDKWTAYIRPRMASLSSAEQAEFVQAALSALDTAILNAQTSIAHAPHSTASSA